MKHICLYFQVHQPRRLARFEVFDIGTDRPVFDDSLNIDVLHRVCDRGYIPANALLLKLIRRFRGQFKAAFSLSGTVLEQMEAFHPSALYSFQELVGTGCIEILGETYYHSLSSVFDPAIFQKEVARHRAAVLKHFGQIPQTFRNTESIYRDALWEDLFPLGFQACITEGVDGLLEGMSVHQVFESQHSSRNSILLRDYARSDDVAFRFTDEEWEHFPLGIQTFQEWIEASEGEVVNIFMDYETLGEHQGIQTGIFAFLEEWISYCLKEKRATFFTPAEIIQHHPIRSTFSTTDWISWADTERDLSAWYGNEMQRERWKIY